MAWLRALDAADCQQAARRGLGLRKSDQVFFNYTILNRMLSQVPGARSSSSESTPHAAAAAAATAAAAAGCELKPNASAADGCELEPNAAAAADGCE